MRLFGRNGAQNGSRDGDAAAFRDDMIAFSQRVLGGAGVDAWLSGK